MSVNAVSSLSSNNVTELQQRKKQLKSISITQSLAGTAAAGLSLLPKNKFKLPCMIASVLLLMGALTTYSKTKQIDKKLNEIA